MQYILVQWSSGNIKTSILTENYVRDKSMLYDCTKEGIISFVTVQRGDTSVVKNKGKLGRIACVSDDRKLVEEHQNLLLAEESEFIDNDIESMCTPRPTSLKRPRYEIENGIDEQDTSFLDGLSSVTGLKQRVLKLVEELTAEKLKVKELQKLNETLQKKLPELLQNAMQSSEVLTELRTCPNCKQSCNDSRSTLTHTSTIASEPILTISTQDTPVTSSNMRVGKTLPRFTSEPSTSNTNESFESVNGPDGIFSPQPMSDMPVVTSVTSRLNTATNIEKSISVYQPSSESQPNMPVVTSVTSRLNTPTNFENGHQDKLNLTLTLPGMSNMTAEADDTLHEASSPESVGSTPVSARQEDKQKLSSGKQEASTSDEIAAVQSLPIEAAYATTYRKMTLALMTHLFDKEVLKVSSVTGSGKSGRLALDKDTVRYIIDHVSQKFPEATITGIKTVMAQKLKDSRRKRNTRS